MSKLTVVTIGTHPHPSIGSLFNSLNKMLAYFRRLRLILIFLIIEVDYFLELLLIPILYLIFVSKKNISLVCEKINFLSFLLF